MKNLRVILVMLIIVLLVGGLSFAGMFLSRVPENPANTRGNLPGNLNNGGLFCELDGKIYFSNPYDGNALYVMESNLSGAKKLVSPQVSMINAAGKYLYFYQSSSGGAGLGYIRDSHALVRTEINGKRPKTLSQDAMVGVQLIGNYVYFEDYRKESDMSLYKTDLEGKEKIVVSPDWINPVGAQNGTIYFNGTGNDHYLYALNTANDSISTVYEGDVWYPTPDGDYVYYLNVADNYKLCRYRLSDRSTETLTTDRVDTFNVYNGVVFYAKSSQQSPALMRMQGDGSGLETVAEGVYEKINIAGGKVFFRPFGETAVLMTEVNGAVQVRPFNP